MSDAMKAQAKHIAEWARVEALTNEEATAELVALGVDVEGARTRLKCLLDRLEAAAISEVTQ